MKRRLHEQSDASDRDARHLKRRQFLTSTAAGAFPLLAGGAGAAAGAEEGTAETAAVGAHHSIIGDYGGWAAGLAPDPPKLSYRRQQFDDVDQWRTKAQGRTAELIASPDIGSHPSVTVTKQYRFGDLDVEELSWELGYGRPTKAIVLKPSDVSGRLPAVLGLHDHGGNKFFGRRKITRTGATIHPMMVSHQQQYYGGRSWANELARRGYVVMVHDTFTFASRRVLFGDMAEIPWGGASTRDKSDADVASEEGIRAYNDWAAAHEHVMAKSLFCAGTTWPGVFLGEDRRALDVLCARDDVDAEHVGCAGLSGGGLRTVYLGGLDSRIKCAVCVGFMSTWKDFLMNKSYTHTWMTYAPLLPNELEFPEILGLRVPRPTLIQSCTEDELYRLPEMRSADRILSAIFEKAGAAECYQGRFYSGGHKFDVPMQQDAFAWFDQWLNS